MEPQITMALPQVIEKSDKPMSLFLSNSMPARDAGFFLYSSGGSSNRSVSTKELVALIGSYLLLLGLRMRMVTTA